MSDLVILVAPSYARNVTRRIYVKIQPTIIRGARIGKNILATATLNHVFGFTGLAAGAHAFISSYSKGFDTPVNLEGAKPNHVVVFDANYVMFGLTAIRAEGQALFSIYYYD
jgi:hypothetical protein